MKCWEIRGDNTLEPHDGSDMELFGNEELFAIMTEEEFENCRRCGVREHLEFDELGDDIHAFADAHPDYFCGILPDISIKSDKLNCVPFKFFVSRNALALVTTEPSPALAEFCKSLDSDKLIARYDDINAKVLLFAVIARLMELENAIVQKIEDDMDSLEESVMREAGADASNQIQLFKRLIMRFRHEIGPQSDAIDTLLANENGLFTSRELAVLRTINVKMQKLESNAALLRDYATQIREAYQAQRDLINNDIMRLFTIIAAIFLPLTLIAGWYGMNFQNMPELRWQYGYPVVIVLSLAVVIGLLWFFKRKKWM